VVVRPAAFLLASAPLACLCDSRRKTRQQAKARSGGSKPPLKKAGLSKAVIAVSASNPSHTKARN